MVDFQLITINLLASRVAKANTSLLDLGREAEATPNNAAKAFGFILSPSTSDRVLKILVQKSQRDGQCQSMCIKFAGDC